MKTVAFACAFTLAIFVGNAFGRTVSNEERELVAIAEAVAASPTIPDDEKIERLSEIERRVSSLRKATIGKSVKLEPKTSIPDEDNPLVTGKPSTKYAAVFPKKESVPDRTDQPQALPHPLLRAGFWLMRMAGWAIVLGVAAAFVLQAVAFFLIAKEKILAALGRRQPPSRPNPAVSNRHSPIGSPLNRTPLPGGLRNATARIPQTPAVGNARQRKGTVTRDGTVPSHLV